MSTMHGSFRRIPLSWTLLCYLISTATADTGCFNPNGTNRNIGAIDVATGTEAYIPCNTVQPYSMCCRTTDKCLPDGLCQQIGSTNIWRESCSDQSWRSPACLKLCVSETGTITFPSSIYLACKAAALIDSAVPRLGDGQSLQGEVVESYGH